MTTQPLETPHPEPPETGARHPSCLRARPTTLLAVALTASFVAVGIAGLVVRFWPGYEDLWQAQQLAQALIPPGTDGHLLGTDNFGRDIFWRLLAATGLSLLLIVTATTALLVLGVALGATAGYYGGIRDRRITQLIDLVWGFPLILAAVVFAGTVGRGAIAAGLAVALTAWAGLARILRAQVRGLRQREFVDAARMQGISEHTILIKHVLPHARGTILVMGSYLAALTILAEASLSFIGLGVQTPDASLGQMIGDGRNYWTVSIWPALIPGIAITVIVVGLNLLADNLRDRHNPRDRSQP